MCVSQGIHGKPTNLAVSLNVGMLIISTKMYSVCPHHFWLQSPTAKDKKTHAAGIPGLCRPALTECMLISFDWEGTRQSLHVLQVRGSGCLTGAFMVTELLKLPLPRPALRAKVEQGRHMLPQLTLHA